MASQRGVALVLVLMVSVLLLGLIIAFLSRVTIERSGSIGYGASATASSLADRAVALVQAQVHHASTLMSGSSPISWASQPGMIRTFNQDGSLREAYKLYSSSKMTVEGVAFAASLSEDRSYSANPALFTDLNSPVVEGGVSHYPILDPGAEGVVEGFKIDSPPTGFLNNLKSPMPVRWLYVLKEGQMIAPTLSGTDVEISGATSQNPIVGRVAFWTDDETAKINVNTAAHGTYWDIPRANTSSERRYAQYQPARLEFQRYPGHPATVSLFPVLGPLLNYTLDADGNPAKEFLELAYHIAPRVEFGGSQAGTVASTTNISPDQDRLYASVEELLFKPNRSAQAPLSKEIVEKAKFFLTASSRAPELNLFHLPRISIWPLNSGSKTNSEVDKLIAFASTVSDVPYYLQRTSPSSPTVDYSSNERLFEYLRHFTKQPIPGFGNATFQGKFSTDTDQIVTQIFDYIRASNVMSTMVGATPFAEPGPGYTDFKAALNTSPGNRAGQISPMINADLDTKGFGRLPVLTKAVLHFYVEDIQRSPANGGGSLLPAKPYPPADKGTPKLADIDMGNLKHLGTTLGATEEMELVTKAVIYFDVFDPMLGYPIVNYNFDLKVSFSGNWAVEGNGSGKGTQSMNFSGIASNEVIIPVRGNMFYGWDGTYDATLSKLPIYGAGNIMGGGRSILWLLNRFRDVNRNSFAPGSDAAYPLISDALKIHPSLPPDTNGTTKTLPSPSSVPLQGAAFRFDGGTAKVELCVDSTVIQTYEFEFPAFVKPVPVYAETSSTQLQQLVIDANFKNRAISCFPMGGPTYKGISTYLAQPGDTIVSLEPAYGDPRLIAGRRNITTDPDTAFAPGQRASGDFVPHLDYATAGVRQALTARIDPLNRGTWTNINFGRFVGGLNYGPNSRPDIPSRYSAGVSVFASNGGSASYIPDFDTGSGFMQDGAYVNRADEGIAYDQTSVDEKRLAWFLNSGIYGKMDPTFYSPSKQLPSAGMFGSLPVGVKRRLPWTTLLFRPDPGGNHPGSENPPDSLLLDLFWMPVVQPYAISEPFSTAGKVNMNYQLMPFTYIERATALYGALLSERLRAVKNSDLSTPAGGDLYKDTYTANNTVSSFSYPIDIKETLKGFKNQFGDGESVFISESQICSLPLIPTGETYSKDFPKSSTWWNDRKATGDNLRERPYVNLLPKLTTKSNTYTIHIKAQALKKRASGDQTIWNEGRDTVMAEYRGSTTTERYITPSQIGIPDYLDPSKKTPNLDSFYRWRIINSKRFAP